MIVSQGDAGQDGAGVDHVLGLAVPIVFDLRQHAHQFHHHFGERQVGAGAILDRLERDLAEASIGYK
jgi:hypothetical protein